MNSIRKRSRPAKTAKGKAKLAIGIWLRAHGIKRAIEDGEIVSLESIDAIQRDAMEIFGELQLQSKRGKAIVRQYKNPQAVLDAWSKMSADGVPLRKRVLLMSTNTETENPYRVPYTERQIRNILRKAGLLRSGE